MQSIILDSVNVCIVVAMCYPVIECVCIGTDMNAMCYPVIECVCIVVAMCYPVIECACIVVAMC